MSGININIMFRAGIIATACLVILTAARGQESWNSGSTWGAGSAVRTTISSGKNNGGGASWAPGRQSFAAPVQPGGIWHDLVVPVATGGVSPMKSPAPSGLMPKSFSGLAGLSLTPAIGEIGVRPATSKFSHAVGGVHFSHESHFGAAHRGHGASPLKRSSTSQGFGAKTGTGSSADSTMETPQQLNTMPSPSLLPDLPNPSVMANPNQLPD